MLIVRGRLSSSPIKLSIRKVSLYMYSVQEVHINIVFNVHGRLTCLDGSDLIFLKGTTNLYEQTNNVINLIYVFSTIESSLCGLCSWIYYHVQMMWSKCIFSKVEFVEGGVFHGEELMLLYLVVF
jgi:hypothetical protein